MKCVILFLLLFFCLDVFAQKDSTRWDLNKYVWSLAHYGTNKNSKTVIDFDAIENWISLPSTRNVSISNDGRYFSYVIENNLSRHLDSLVVQSTFDGWRQSVANSEPGFFSSNAMQYIYSQKYNEYKKELCFLELYSRQIHCVKDVISYKLPTDNTNECMAFQLNNSQSTVVLQYLVKGDKKQFDSISFYDFDKSSKWFICQSNGTSKKLIIYNLKSDKQFEFNSVKSWQFSSKGDYLLLSSDSGLSRVRLMDGKINTVWSRDNTSAIRSCSFDGSGNQVVFVLRQKENSIWYWKEGIDKARNIISDQTSGIGPKLMIREQAAFTGSDHYIRFELQQRADLRKSNSNSAAVDVWSYHDIILQSAQPSMLMQPKSYTCIFDVENENIIRVETDSKRLKYKQMQGSYALIFQSGKDLYGNRFWEKDYYQDSCWIVSFQDGVSSYVGRVDTRLHFSISPSGKYLVFSDYDQGCAYFSYNVDSRRLTNISAGVPVGQFCYKWHFRRNSQKYAAGIAGWLEGDEGILVYDNYDIWRLDPTGKTAAKNITNGYGQKHKIELAFDNSDRDNQLAPVFLKHDTLLLKAFNKRNKYNGYYRVVLDSIGDPELLYMGPYFFESLANHSFLDPGMRPLKARDIDSWIVKRQSPTDAPNYYLTTNFKTYKRLTDFQPQKGYNWLTRELHSFKQLDGSMTQGVLTKPENFDPEKKYPVIIAFYGSLSDQLNQYPVPKYLDDPSPFDNPAWFVSQGYLLFTPDVCFIEGQWGPSTVNAIDAAARYLGQLPYVDAQCIGACGHSNSGTTGYYLLTHSHLFAAMSLGAGTADVISRALSLYTDNESELEGEEILAYMTGLGNLWKNKESWLDHTSVLHVDKVTSPLLIFHNKKDGVAVRQAIEMFLSLQRLEKKSWWLQYDEGDHIIYPGKDQQDFTIRTTQFYDHYLKGAPAPLWMTRGIPYALKGVEQRYELDPVGNCGNDCSICKAWNKQYKRTLNMFSKAVNEWELDKDLQAELVNKKSMKYKDNTAKDSVRIKSIVKQLNMTRKE